MSRHRAAVAVVWAATLVAAVTVPLAAPAAVRLAALVLVLAVSVVVAIAVQLAVGEREGFVERLAACACGSFAIVVVAGVVALAASGA